LDCGSENNPTELEDLANMINRTFLEPTKDFDALLPETGDDIPIENIRSYHVSEMSVDKKLANLIKTKATGPDGIPAWLLKENSDILGAPISDILKRVSLNRGNAQTSFQSPNRNQFKK
jgi:Zn-dependent peptidase ImmA (M78 family)